MNKKGFTLIEIISVISILAIIGLIAVPVANNIIKKSKTKMYDEQTSRIEQACRNYVLENDDLLPEEGKTTKVTIKKLKDSGYLPNESIINPLTEEEMKGGILISYSNNKYTYTYDDNIKEFAIYYPGSNEGDFMYVYSDNINRFTQYLNEYISAPENEYMDEYQLGIYGKIGDRYIMGQGIRFNFPISNDYIDEMEEIFSYETISSGTIISKNVENSDIYMIDIYPNSYIPENYIAELIEYFEGLDTSEVSSCDMNYIGENIMKDLSELSDEEINSEYTSCIESDSKEIYSIYKFPLTSERNLD